MLVLIASAALKTSPSYRSEQLEYILLSPNN
jgi:hypothetical protein